MIQLVQREKKLGNENVSRYRVLERGEEERERKEEEPR